MVDLHAPKLQALTLYDGQPGNRVHLLDFLGEVKLKPIQLNLDLSMPEKTIENLIRKLWRNVEELQLVYKGVDKSLWYHLASSLKGRGIGEFLCPNLRQLVVLSQKRSAERQAKSENLLRAIKNAFNKNGKLLEVRYGWYEKVEEGIYHGPRNSPVRWTTFTD
jgi:hypothetical protein